LQLDDEDLIGTIVTDDTQKRTCARESLAFNSRSPAFLKLFPEYTQIVHALQLTRSNSSHGSAEDLLRASNSSTDTPITNRNSNNDTNITNVNNNSNASGSIKNSEPILIAPNTKETANTTARPKRANSSGHKPVPSTHKVVPQPTLAQSTEAVFGPDSQHHDSPKQSRSPLNSSQSVDLDAALKEFQTASGRRRLERDISGPLLREIARLTGLDESKVALPILEIKSVDLGLEDRVGASGHEDGEGSLTVPNNTTPTNNPSKSSSPHSDSAPSTSSDVKLEVRAKMRISFANWPFLQPNKIEGTPEQQREKAKARLNSSNLLANIIFSRLLFLGLGRQDSRSNSIVCPSTAQSPHRLFRN